METTLMNEPKIRALVKEIAKGIKTEADISELTKAIRKTFSEAALSAELNDHLGYEEHELAGIQSNLQTGISSR